MTAGHAAGPSTCEKCYQTTRNLVLLCPLHAAAPSMKARIETLEAEKAELL